MHNWGVRDATATDPSVLMEVLVGLVGSEEGLYLAVEGMTAQVLEVSKLLVCGLCMGDQFVMFFFFARVCVYVFCMYVCMFVCMHLCMYVCMYV